MSNIELFNSSLNTTDDDRYNLWRDYRNQVNDLLLDYFSKLDNKDLIIVVGAGRCEDFSLRLLIDNFKKVVLTDIDLSSIKEAIDKLNLSVEERKKISIERIEYTGFEKNQFFEHFEKNMLMSKSIEQVEKFINKSLADLNRYRFLKSYTGQADFIMVTPIYTQLVYQQVLMSLSKLRSQGYPENLLKFVEGYMSEKIIEIFEVFNKNLVNALGDGFLFVLSDIFEGYSDSEFIINVKKSIDSYSKMEAFYKDYQSDYGYGLGDLGLLLLDEQVDVVGSKWLLWPFSKGVDLVVKLAIYK